MNKIFYAFIVTNVISLGILFYLNVQIYFQMKKNTGKTEFSQNMMKEVQESKTFLEQDLIKKTTLILSKEQSAQKEKEKAIEVSRKLSDKINSNLFLKNRISIMTGSEKILRKDKSLLEAEIKKLKESIKKLKESEKNLTEMVKTLKKNPVFHYQNSVSSKEQAIDKRKKKSVLMKKKSSKNSGLILNYNTTYNFVLIDLGVEDNIHVGDYLKVLRNKKEIGKIRIENVFAHESSAVILEKKSKKSPFMLGDRVLIMNSF